MIAKRNITDRILFGVVVCCIFSFKFILIGIGESGIRLDDFLVLFAFVVLLLRGDLRSIPCSRQLNIYLVFVGWSLLSALWNSAAGRVLPVTSLMFVIRLLQYVVFYCLGYVLRRRRFSFVRVLTIYLVVLCLAVPLQMRGIVPVPGVFEGITSRAVGNTNGPYELAVVAAFLLCYLGYLHRRRVMTLASILLVLLSASRITSVFTALSLAKVGLRRLKAPGVRVLAFMTLLLIGLAGFSFVRANAANSNDEAVGLVARLSSAASGTSPDTLISAYAQAPVYRNSGDYYNGQFSSAIDQAVSSDSDASGLIRLFRWTTLIKTTLGSVDSLFLGLGPSFGSAAVDGYFVRVFVENGAIGLALFLWFAWTMVKGRKNSSDPFREYVFIMLGTACFIDIFVSYKPMLLLWLWHGMNQVRTGRGSIEDRLLHEG